jgi:hypothetical protein
MGKENIGRKRSVVLIRAKEAQHSLMICSADKASALF